MNTPKSIVLMIVVLNTVAILCAGSVDYLTNQSVPFLRTLARGAATDETDAILYNPAGTTQMPDGIYTSFHWQGFTKAYAIKDKAGKKFESNTPSPFIPSFLAMHKKENLALFFAFTVPAGGGTLEYKDGLQMVSDLGLTDGYFKGSSIYYGYTLGFAYQVDEMLSFSVASRMITSIKEYEGKATHPQAGELKLESEKSPATSNGGIFGLNLNFLRANIGLKYETQTTLKYKTKTKVNGFTQMLPQFDNGYVEYRDLPAQLSVGASLSVTENINLNAGILYFFLQKAAQDNTLAYQNYNDGIEYQLGTEYFLNEKWLFSLGYNYIIVGGNKQTYTDFEYQLDSHFIGAGFRFAPTEQVLINFALAKPFYQTSKGVSGAEYSKDVNILGVGVEYKF